jgi:uncharacterized alpha/beta hydrolase family protein
MMEDLKALGRLGIEMLVLYSDVDKSLSVEADVDKIPALVPGVELGAYERSA